MDILYDSSKTEYENERKKKIKDNAIYSALFILLTFSIFIFISNLFWLSNNFSKVYTYSVIISSLTILIMVIYLLIWKVIYLGYLRALEGFKIFDEYIQFTYNNKKIRFSSITKILDSNDNILLELDSSNTFDRKKRYPISKFHYPLQDKNRIMKILKMKIKLPNKHN